MLPIIDLFICPTNTSNSNQISNADIDAETDKLEKKIFWEDSRRSV